MQILAAILGVILLCSIGNADAQTRDTRPVSDQLMSQVSQLDEAQKQELLAKATDIRNGSSSAQTAREWVDIGTSLGQGLAATARELGVAVNDFAKSPVGIIAIVLIVWNYMGDTIIHLGTAFVLIGVFLPVWYRVFSRLYGVYNDAGKLMKFDFEQAGEAAAFFSILSFCGILVSSTAILLTA